MSDTPDRRDEGGGPPESERLPDDERLRELYRGLPAQEPRAEIDVRILEAARRSAAPRPRGVLRRLRWTVPLAAAAGVALTLVLTRLTPEQQTMPARLASSDSDHRVQNERDARRDLRARRNERRRESKDMAAAERAKTREPAPSEAPAAAPSPATQAMPAAPPPPKAEAGAQARESLRSLGYLEDAAPTAKKAPSGAAASESDAEDAAWPFGLQPGMNRDAACVQLRSALAIACEARGDTVELVLAPPRTIDSGAVRGRTATRITLHFGGGKLVRLELWLAGSGAGDKVVLEAPPAS